MIVSGENSQGDSVNFYYVDFSPRERCDVTLYSFTSRTSRAILITRLDLAPIFPAFPALVPVSKDWSAKSMRYVSALIFHCCDYYDH